MDLVITVAIVALLVAIILGSLRRGIQSLISFAVLGLLAAFVVIRISGESSASPAFLGIGQNGDAEPLAAETQFQDFSRSVGNYLGTWSTAQADGTNTAFGNQGTDAENTDTGTGTTDFGTAANGTAANGTRTPGADDSPEMTDSDASDSPSGPGTRDPIPAWW